MAATRSCARAGLTGLNKQWAKHTAQMLWCCSAKKYEDSKLFQRRGMVVHHHSLQHIHFRGCFPGKSGFAGFRPWFSSVIRSGSINQSIYFVTHFRGLRFLQAGCPFSHPTNSVKALTAARKITHRSHPFLIHCWTPEEESCFLYTSSPTD